MTIWQDLFAFGVVIGFLICYRIDQVRGFAGVKSEWRFNGAIGPVSRNIGRRSKAAKRKIYHLA